MPRGKTSRAETTAASREAVLTAARLHFSQRGYEGANVRDIAAAAGRSTGTVFSHWEGKADLFRAATGRPAPDVRAFLEQIAIRVGPARDKTPVQARQLLADLYGEAARIPKADAA